MIGNNSTNKLLQEQDTRKAFSTIFDGLVKNYGLGEDRSKHDKRKSTLGQDIGVGGGQITRYAKGEQMPSLETFAKICIQFQLDPAQLLGLAWEDGTKIEDGAVTKWVLKDDLQMGGLRLYWTCDGCDHRNIEYMDENGVILEMLERQPSKLAYNFEKLRAYSDELKATELMCEQCGKCFNELKDFEAWRRQNT